MTFTPETARAWVDVDLRALVANARTLVGLTGTRLLPMVKANGYGLGAVAVARALESLDPWGYGVASVEEGAALRAAGIARPVLVVSPLLPDAIDAHLAHDLRPTIGDLPALAAWCRRGARPFHVEIDTGMSRAGLRWDDAPALVAAAALLREAEGWEGLFTHFHSADTDPGSVGGAVGSVPGRAGDDAPPAGPGARRQQRRRPPGPAVRGRPDPPGHLSLRRCRGCHWTRAQAGGHAPGARRGGARGRRRRDRELRRHLARAARDDGRHARAGIRRRLSPGRPRGRREPRLGACRRG